MIVVAKILSLTKRAHIILKNAFENWPVIVSCLTCSDSVWVGNLYFNHHYGQVTRLLMKLMSYTQVGCSGQTHQFYNKSSHY